MNTPVLAIRVLYDVLDLFFFLVLMMDINIHDLVGIYLLLTTFFSVI